jgi:hypothetical protein
MNQIIINASREGARYGITYKTNTIGTRLAPSALTPTIQNYILNTYLPTTILPLNANPTVNVGGSGYSTGAKGNPVEVTVTAIKTWYLLSMVPSMGYSKNLTATTVMLCE